MKRHRCSEHRPRPLRYLTLSVVLLLLLVYVQPGQSQTGPLNSEVIQVSPYYSYFETTLEDGTKSKKSLIFRVTDSTSDNTSSLVKRITLKPHSSNTLVLKSSFSSLSVFSFLLY